MAFLRIALQRIKEQLKDSKTKKKGRKELLILANLDHRN